MLVLCAQVFMFAAGKQGLFLFRARKAGAADAERTKGAMKTRGSAGEGGGRESTRFQLGAPFCSWGGQTL